MEKEIINKIRFNMDKLISKSFPKLKNEQIDVKVWRNTEKKFPMAAALFKQKSYIIKVNPNIALLNKKALIGLLAHELVHIENYTKKSIFRNVTERIKDELLCRLLFHLPFLSNWERKYKKKHKKVDEEVIKRGYGCELLEYSYFLNRFLKPKLLKERSLSYLSENEIKKFREKLK